MLAVTGQIVDKSDCKFLGGAVTALISADTSP